MSPHSSPVSSVPSTPTSNVPTTLTPSKKVQALLAQFSDSDTDAESAPNRKSVIASAKSPLNLASVSLESESDEYEDEVQPRGRLAARLLGKGLERNTDKRPDKTTRSNALQINQTTISEPIEEVESKPTNPEPNDGEIAITAPARERLLGNQKVSPKEKTQILAKSTRSVSPLFFPSPSSTRRSFSPQTIPRQSAATSPVAKSNDNGRSKFLALVNKHRKERIAREAAEIAKRAAGVTDADDATQQRVRGSSPADDSSEDSPDADKEAIRRIQKQARPTRKASKKALEEMNRETQRISRSMQLAHQAKTKKKITKESLLARFNFGTNGTETDMRAPKDTTVSSSATVSDAESRKNYMTTPPTSPLRETEEAIQEPSGPQVKDTTHLLSSGQVVAEMHGALIDEEELPGLEELVERQTLNMRTSKPLEYQQHDTTFKSPKISNESSLVTVHSPAENKAHTVPEIRPVRISLARAALARAGDSDSDGEIDIVKDRGLKRKYAAFETLPKRKAKEMPSHLALRSLAHLVSNDVKKRSMNAAELESSLRRKARIQALEERQRRIEDLKAKGIVIQSAEERERDQQEVEDLVERARQEAVEIQKREKELAQKDGTYVRDGLDDEDDESEDADFEEELADSQISASEGDDAPSEAGDKEDQGAGLIEDEVDEADFSQESEVGQEEEDTTTEPELEGVFNQNSRPRLARKTRVVSDDEEEDEELPQEKDVFPPRLLAPAKTPTSVPRSARKMIPGLQMSDDLPMRLSQAFAATMAESLSQEFDETQEQDSLDLTADLPSPGLAPMPMLRHLDSIDLVSDSQPSASQNQPLNVNLLSQSQMVPESPHGLGIHGMQYTPTQRQIPFELTQDNGYVVSPFTGNRFSETPDLNAPHSTVETVVLPQGIEDSPILRRRGRLQRRQMETDEGVDTDAAQPTTAFQVMKQAAKIKAAHQDFDKKKSDARNIVDEAAEESEDEYAGLGGASDDSGDDEENEADRQMIDEDTQIGRGDEAKLAGLYADRERERDEKEVSKLLKDITTGALRRKRGVGDELDLSDEEDAIARRRETKRREFARMRRELLKDEAIGKIAEDRKKEAFLRSIEDRDAANDGEEDFDQPETTQELQSQSLSQNQDIVVADSQEDLQTGQKRKYPLDATSDSQINRMPPPLRRTNPNVSRKPATLAEIRESVSFLIEEPDSQSAMVDLGLSDSEDEPEAYVDLDRHFREAEADENEVDEDNEDLGDFVVDDETSSKEDSQSDIFKKPELPRQERAPFTERRTKHIDVVDRLSLLRQASSSASSTTSTTSASTKMAFFSSKTGGSFSGVPTLLRRATTNSGLGSRSGRENVSATGVVTSKTERGSAGEEKDFVRKGNGGRRNAVNYQADRKTLREEKMSARAGVLKAGKTKKGHGFLGGLFRGDSWE